MNTRLTPDLTKLNAKFEGYKLEPFSETSNLFRSSLADQGNILIHNDTNNQHHRMGFRDLQARIRHSHLSYGYPLDQNRGSAFCIDQDFNLQLIVFDKVK